MRQSQPVDLQVWVGELFLGSEKMPMSVVFDTSSDWLAVEDKSCDTCLDAPYEAAASATALQINPAQVSRNIANAQVTVTEWSDTVCLTESQCIDDFGFYLIEEQTGIKEPVDGYLGLARVEPFLTGSLQDISYKRGPSFMSALVQNGLISQNIFSLEIGQGNGDKFIHFGAPLEDKMKDPEKITYISLMEDLFWATNCQGIAFDSLDNSYRFPNIESEFVRNNQVYSIFDSESSRIVLPEFLFPSFVETIFKEAGGS